MWEKLNNSSLLFSKSFIKNKDADHIYSNRVLLNRIYFYYINKGFYNIIINSLVDILVTNFLVFFLIFLMNCIDYHELFTSNERQNLGNFIHIDHFFSKLNNFFLSILILFFVLDLVKIISLVDDCYVFGNIRKFYGSTLKIKDSEIEYLSWKDVLSIWQEVDNTQINPYYINILITTKESYFISLIDQKIIKPMHLNSIFEWNLIYSIIYSIIDSKENICGDLLKDTKKVSNQIKIKFKIIAILNMIFMPLIIIFIVFYNLFNYGEQFYNKPSMLISKNFSRISRWKLRNYNEPSHQFDERIEKIESLTKQYYNSFKSKLINATLKFVIFILSSVFITLVLLTIINDNVLINLTIIGGRNVLWFLGLIGSLIAILRSILNIKNDDSPQDIMSNLSKYMVIDDDIISNANTTIVKKKFLENYKLKFQQIVLDILFTLIMPIQLWSISYDSDYIADYLKNITKKHDKIGYICLFSDLENENSYYFGSLIRSDEKNHLIKKINFSDEVLINQYPEVKSVRFNHSANINFI